MKRDAETIEAHLESRYPWHESLKDDVASLKEAGFTSRNELERVSYSSLTRYVSPLLSMALRDYIKNDQSDPVEFECTRTMRLECTEASVALREENEIPELPDQFSPVFSSETEEEINVEPAEQEEQDEELRVLGEAYNDLPSPVRPGLLKSKVYDFTTRQSQKALGSIWCKTNGWRILERPSYEALRQKVMALWKADVNAILLLGVPGIGKTGFIITMLLELMKERKAVVFQTKGGFLYLYEPEHAKKTERIGQDYRCFRLKSNGILLDSGVYYLVDGKLPAVPDFGCKTLLAATPKLSNFQDYEKDGRGKKVMLPVWTAAEIALAWQEIFDPNLPHLKQSSLEEHTDGLLEARRCLTLDVVKERYRKWGGTARYVLEMPQVNLEAVISGLQSIQQTVEAVAKQIADGEHPSHKIVHQRVKRGYDEYEYMFASPFVVEAARKKLKESTSGALRLFLSFKGLEAHGVNGCKEYIFEHEFRELAIGNHFFPVRRVYEDITNVGADGFEHFEFGQVYEVGKIEDLVDPLPVNRMIWPASKIEETIDALRIRSSPGELPILEVYQVTLSSRRHAHGLKYEGMLRVMQQVGIPPSRTRVYIVTTSELYQEAGYQNWRRSGNLVLRDDRILRHLVGVTQYALCSRI